MLKQHTFNVILVKGSHGADAEVTGAADKIVKYERKAMAVGI